MITNKYKRYVDEIKKLAKNNQNLRVNVKPYGSGQLVTLRHGPGNGTYVDSHPIYGTNDVYIAWGKTHPKLRSQGIGKKLRALITLAAKRAGFKKVHQTSAFTNTNTTAPTNKETKKGNVNKTGKTLFRYPPSSYVMKSLGFNEVYRNANGHYLNHEYNFSKKPNNKKLLNALVISHPIKNTPKPKQRILYSVKSTQPMILKKIGNRTHPGIGYNANLTFNNRSNLVNAANSLNKVHFTPAQRKYIKAFMNTLVNNARYFGEEQEHIIRHATEPNRYKLWGLNFRIKNGNMYGARNNLWHRNVKVITRPYGRVGIKFVRQNFEKLRGVANKVNKW